MKTYIDCVKLQREIRNSIIKQNSGKSLSKVVLQIQKNVERNKLWINAQN
jgi:hypothetical protein